ncbi:FAD/NAD(P)-binding domain-containing protein [Auricularia subglabra TFB-10046 SS5]|nr:FAD/NAD(P)-binding domain-containing protein [Auricularia subglabra TFB-10046 SS5]
MFSQSSQSKTTPRIAIIGAGPIGRNNVPAILYERDEERETGHAAIKAAGVWEAFVAHSRPEGMEVLVTDRKGDLFHRAPSPETEKTARPEIDRTVRRRILVDGAPAGSVKWGHALSSVAPVPGTKERELRFANGFKTVVDLVVGADGGRSGVRPLVSDAEVQYTGITGVEVSSGYPSRQPSTRSSRRAWATAPPWLRELVAVADRNAVYPRSLYMLPVGQTWTHCAGVTLTGDAMNFMTPFAGKGANIAMYGAMQLGLAPASVRNRPTGELDAKIAEHERKLCLRAAEDAKVTEHNMKAAMFAPHGFKDHFRIFFIDIAKRFMAQHPILD